MKYFKMMPERGGFTPKEEEWFKKGAPIKREKVESSGGTEQEAWDQMKLEAVLEQVNHPTPETAKRGFADFQRDFKEAYEAAKANPKDKEAAARLDSLIAYYNKNFISSEKKVTPPKTATRKVNRFEATA